MINQLGKKIICGPLSPIASLAFDFISSYENIGTLQRSGKTRAGKNQIKMKLILSVKM